MKKIFLLLITANLFFAHSAKKGDLEGAWILVEQAWNDEQVAIEGPIPLKVFSQGRFFVSWNGAENQSGFNEGTYELANGEVLETILNSSVRADIGNQVSYKPNFMGDKKSFYQEITWTSPEGENFTLFERWENVSCAEEKCARLRKFSD